MKMLLAALGGAVIGAGAALLFAPQTGRASRAMVKDRATKYANEAGEFVDSKARHLKNKAKGYRNKAEKLMEQGQEMLEQGKDAMEMQASDGTRQQDPAPA